MKPGLTWKLASVDPNPAPRARGRVRKLLAATGIGVFGWIPLAGPLVACNAKGCRYDDAGKYNCGPQNCVVTDAGGLDCNPEDASSDVDAGPDGGAPDGGAAHD